MAKSRETLACIAARDRAALAPYQKLEAMKSRTIIESFFADPWAPIQEMIELRSTLTPDYYRYEQWVARYGTGDEAKIAQSSFQFRIWQYFVTGEMLSEVLATIQQFQYSHGSGAEVETREALVSKLVKRRVKLMCGFFTVYRYAIQSIGEKDPENAIHFLTASVYRQLKRLMPKGTTRLAIAIEEERVLMDKGETPERFFQQVLASELPTEVVQYVTEAGLSPASVAEMHNKTSDGLKRFLSTPRESIKATRESNLPEAGALAYNNSEGGPEPEQEFLAKDAMDRWQQRLDRLPEKERLTMQLHLQGHSRQEIAAQRGVSEETIKTQLEKARAKLRPHEEDAA